MLCICICICYGMPCPNMACPVPKATVYSLQVLSALGTAWGAEACSAARVLDDSSRRVLAATPCDLRPPHAYKSQHAPC